MSVTTSVFSVAIFSRGSSFGFTRFLTMSSKSFDLDDNIVRSNMDKKFCAHHDAVEQELMPSTGDIPVKKTRLGRNPDVDTSSLTDREREGSPECEYCRISKGDVETTLGFTSAGLFAAVFTRRGLSALYFSEMRLCLVLQFEETMRGSLEVPRADASSSKESLSEC
ncbi:hypothetical protein HF521_017708 [Silurus meridionalis]|uniref:Uncharacterized protein n=1 Tax=Silurus meridionalis TaxID=175797 RepID=A0A8T0BMT0_SILME|nr:hypothetical protein HF521_017708 [Silurus meridionalis]